MNLRAEKYTHFLHKAFGHIQASSEVTPWTDGSVSVMLNRRESPRPGLIFPPFLSEQLLLLLDQNVKSIGSHFPVKGDEGKLSISVHHEIRESFALDCISPYVQNPISPRHQSSFPYRLILSYTGRRPRRNNIALIAPNSLHTQFIAKPMVQVYDLESDMVGESYVFFDARNEPVDIVAASEDILNLADMRLMLLN